MGGDTLARANTSSKRAMGSGLGSEGGVEVGVSVTLVFYCHGLYLTRSLAHPPPTLGSATMNVVPCIGPSLVTVTVPPCASTR